MAELIQLFEIVNESHGGISPDEIAAHFPIVKDWAGRLCVSVEDAARALAMAPPMKFVPFGATERWVKSSG